MLVACATNDGKTITKKHFGDAKYFSIYEILENKINFIRKIENTARDGEYLHSEKAKAILELLVNNNVELLINRAFGTNLKIINQYLLPVIIRVDLIITALEMVQTNYELIEKITLDKKDCYLLISKEKEVRLVETK